MTLLGIGTGYRAEVITPFAQAIFYFFTYNFVLIWLGFESYFPITSLIATKQRASFMHIVSQFSFC